MSSGDPTDDQPGKSTVSELPLLCLSVETLSLKSTAQDVPGCSLPAAKAAFQERWNFNSLTCLVMRESRFQLNRVNKCR